MKTINHPVDFPIDLEKREPEKTYTFYLTISCILKDNFDITEFNKLQDSLLQDIQYGEIAGSRIYRYPENNLHFSIINFEKLSKLLVEQKTFEQIIDEKICTARQILKDFNFRKIDDKKIDFAYIYTPKSSALTLQAFPSKDLLKLFKEIKEKFDTRKEWGAKIKGNPKENPYMFATNLIRFFEKPDDDNEFPLFAERVRELNIESQSNNLFSGNLKRLTLVVSDSYLSNENREKFYIDLK